MERQIKIAKALLASALEEAFPDCTFSYTVKEHMHHTLAVLVESVPFEKFTPEFIAYQQLQRNPNIVGWRKYNERLRRVANVHTPAYHELIRHVKRIVNETASYSKSGLLAYVANSVH